MAVPKKRTTKTKTNTRRSHMALKPKTSVKCSNCGKEILPHRMCSYCGYYKGRQVVDMMAKVEKKNNKQKAK